MLLGVPTLCRYDLLEELLRSAEKGSLRPSGYVIIDNGVGYPRERLVEQLGSERAADVILIAPGRNLGVAASWNRFLDIGRSRDEPIIIANDDIVLGPDTFAEMARALDSVDFVGDRFYLFGQTPKVLAEVGYYDENFWPAYYEDSDYEVRLHRAGVRRAHGVPGVQHQGAASSVPGDPAIASHQARNRQYFLRKWNGKMLGQDPIENFTEPWGGSPPAGFRLRNPIREVLPVMRWDVLNHIANVITARRYLEIGVSTGECLRRVSVPEKWGVDPNPHPSAVTSASIFVGHQSDAFFELVPLRAIRFDLVFIDGYHEAEQVYREVTNASRVLRPGGVIVLHDCNPETEAMQDMADQRGDWTGNVWKAVARLRSDIDPPGHLAVIDSDYGIGVLVPGATPPRIPLSKEWNELTYADLERDRSRLLGLVSAASWKEWFEKVYAEAQVKGHYHAP